MRTLLGTAVVLALACGVAADDKKDKFDAKKLVGKWEPKDPKKGEEMVMELTADGFEIETQIVVNSLRRGLRIAEIPSQEAERLNGESHLHPVRDGLRVLSTILQARFGRLTREGPGARSLAPDSIG